MGSDFGGMQARTCQALLVSVLSVMVSGMKVNLTVYRLTPVNVTGVGDKDR